MTKHSCVVNHFCCGYSLRGGSLASGIIVSIPSLLFAIYVIIGTIKHGGAGGWIIFVLHTAAVLVSCLLIVGVQQERRSYVMVWVWTMAVIILINSILSIIIVIIGIEFTYGLITLVAMVVYIYLVVVVRSTAWRCRSGVAWCGA